MTGTAARRLDPEQWRERRKPLPARTSLFYRQVIAELRKVIWPTRKELITYTTVVIVFVLMIIAYVSVLDLGFGQGVLNLRLTQPAAPTEPIGRTPAGSSRNVSEPPSPAEGPRVRPSAQ